MRIDRRQALAALGIGAALPGTASAATYNGDVSFKHGVASGDPLADRVILWTRITPTKTTSESISYRWTLTPMGSASGGARSGSGVTDMTRDFTVKVDATGLKPGQPYSFQFTANGAVSPTGLTRTLPKKSAKDVVLAVASCALYPAGYFNAYGAIAALERVDAVLHLGDYIYEYGGPGSYGMDSAVAGERPHAPNREIISLADYRVRHAQYKSDPQLQAAHAKAPWIVVWDDHETANDSFKDGAENHQADEGLWVDRKARAIKAYYEWMPIREPLGDKLAINRVFHFGDIASLLMVETRLTARDKQLSYSRDLNGADGKPDAPAFRKKLSDPTRRMMGPAQEAWLATELGASVKAGRTWQILGNEVIMARVNVASFKAGMGEAALSAALANLPPEATKRIDRLEAIAALGLPYGLDMWDGYPVDRQRLFGLIRRAKANVVVVSGDSHAFWANELYDAPEGGNRVAVEFGTTGITSPGGGDALPGIPVGEIYAKANREILHNDQRSKGFVLLTLSKAEMRADFIAVSTIAERNYTTAIAKSFQATPGPTGVSGLQEV